MNDKPKPPTNHFSDDEEYFSDEVFSDEERFSDRSFSDSDEERFSDRSFSDSDSDYDSDNESDDESDNGNDNDDDSDYDSDDNFCESEPIPPKPRRRCVASIYKQPIPRKRRHVGRIDIEGQGLLETMRDRELYKEMCIIRYSSEFPLPLILRRKECIKGRKTTYPDLLLYLYAFSKTLGYLKKDIYDEEKLPTIVKNVDLVCMYTDVFLNAENYRYASINGKYYRHQILDVSRRLMERFKDIDVNEQLEDYCRSVRVPIVDANYKDLM